MARVILGSYMVRYPLGGMASWVLQYLLGFRALGHDVWFVEKADYPLACFDPAARALTDDATTGIAFAHALLSRWGLGDRWCFVDYAGSYHGMDRAAVEAVFDDADVFIDMGTSGSWLPEAERTRRRVLVDGEPGFTQMKMELRRRAGAPVPQYDAYFSTGQNVGTPACLAPDAGVEWRHLFHPVMVDLFSGTAPGGSRLTTEMNWQSYRPLEYEGRSYGHKDVEFAKFAPLPSRSPVPLELAVWGKATPATELRAQGWELVDGHAVTTSFDSFRDYVRGSYGEFGVCKNGFVAARTGWFSDRTAAYLAAGRPAVVQDTGFSAHLPCGSGLFAVESIEEAADAIAAISGSYARHCAAAEEVAREFLDAPKVLGRMLDEAALRTTPPQ